MAQRKIPGGEDSVPKEKKSCLPEKQETNGQLRPTRKNKKRKASTIGEARTTDSCKKREIMGTQEKIAWGEDSVPYKN